MTALRLIVPPRNTHVCCGAHIGECVCGRHITDEHPSFDARLEASTLRTLDLAAGLAALGDDDERLDGPATGGAA